MNFAVVIALGLLVAFAQADDRIISVDKPARQSTTDLEYNAQLAVDGRSYQDFSRGSCSQTKRGKHNWWEVDLVYDYRLTQVSVHISSTVGNQVGKFKVTVYGKNHKHKRTYGIHWDATKNGQVIYFAKEMFHVQYVRISHTNSHNNPLRLCEVTIIGEREKAVDDYKEVAQRAYATQSSTAKNFRAHLAVDGDLEANRNLFACTLTKKKLKSWWKVDLHHFYSIDRVVVYGNINGDNSAGLNVQIKKKGSKKWHFCGQTSKSGSRAINIVKCNYKVGQLVRVISNDHRAVSLCEVRVYARRAFNHKEKKHPETAKRAATDEEQVKKFEDEEA